MLAQRSFEDLGAPLSGVTFCVVDLETTGGSPASDTITEIGALKVRRGEVDGTFQTLVHPGAPVPAFVRLLTGITDDMLRDAPPIEAVLPSFLEFARGSVLVAHNARFDIGFLNTALSRHGYPPLAHRVVDTALLARKILAGEVRNNRLATLADHLRCAHRPTHRAFADVLATTDVLHHLIERVAGFGVTTLEDLIAVSRTKLDGTFAKIGLADDVPAALGIYRFVGTNGKTLYVGKAADLRARVRSYFHGDPRSRMRSLLGETQEVLIEPHATMLEAEVAEARAIVTERPHYNRAGVRPARWYLKVSLRAGVPRLGAARRPRDDGAIYLGPLASRRAVDQVLLALRDGLALHRCTDPARCAACPFSRLGTCAGADPARHRKEVRRAAMALIGDPTPLLDVLDARMRRLAGETRFEEASEARARAAALESAVARSAEARSLIDAGDVAFLIGRRAVLLRAGQLAAAVDVEADEDPLPRLAAAARAEPVGAHTPAELHLEISVVARWIRRHANEIRLLAVTGTWAHPAGARPPERFRVRDDVHRRT